MSKRIDPSATMRRRPTAPAPTTDEVTVPAPAPAPADAAPTRVETFDDRVTADAPEATNAPARAARQSSAPKPRPARAEAPPRQPGTTAKSTGSEPASSGGEGAANKGIPIHLSPDLTNRLKAYMESNALSHATVLLDALEYTVDDLPALVQDALSAQADVQPRRGSLFQREVAIAPRSTEARIKHSVRVSNANRQIIDELAKRVGAPNRIFLIATAYEAFLPPLTES